MEPNRGHDGRESNNAQARFAAEALEVSNVEFIPDDVRNLCQEMYGRLTWYFAQPLLSPSWSRCLPIHLLNCSGLQTPSITIHIRIESEVSISWEGHSYQGFVYKEHSPNDTLDVKAIRKWNLLRRFRFANFDTISLRGRVY